MPTTTDTTIESTLHTRIRAEFREMPGLRLNLWQASRLFHIEPDRCLEVLGLLVQTGALMRQGEIFTSPSAGRAFV